MQCGELAMTSAAVLDSPVYWTADRLSERFGPIPLHRIRTDPAPGTATEDNVVEPFTHGSRLVWYVDLKTQSIQVFTSVTEGRVAKVNDTLDGGDVLPGFALNIRELFAELPPE
jgi:hypothetical protein